VTHHVVAPSADLAGEAAMLSVPEPVVGFVQLAVYGAVAAAAAVVLMRHVVYGGGRG
jgi:xanthine/uracil permease